MKRVPLEEDQSREAKLDHWRLPAMRTESDWAPQGVSVWIAPFGPLSNEDFGVPTGTLWCWAYEGVRREGSGSFAAPDRLPKLHWWIRWDGSSPLRDVLLTWAVDRIHRVPLAIHARHVPSLTGGVADDLQEISISIEVHSIGESGQRAANHWN